MHPNLGHPAAPAMVDRVRPAGALRLVAASWDLALLPVAKGGRDFRLTDVSGNLSEHILA
jgi:hypothetical protein